MRFVFALAFDQKNIPDSNSLWKLICDGPEIIRPRTAGVCEPLKRVQLFESISFESEILWRNGRKCIGYFQPFGFRGKAILSLNMEYKSEEHTKIFRSVHEWLSSNFKYVLLYGISPNEELAKTNIELQQLVSCGAIPPDESIIRNNSELFEVYESNA